MDLKLYTTFLYISIHYRSSTSPHITTKEARQQKDQPSQSDHRRVEGRLMQVRIQMLGGSNQRSKIIIEFGAKIQAQLATKSIDVKKKAFSRSTFFHEVVKESMISGKSKLNTNWWTRRGDEGHCHAGRTNRAKRCIRSGGRAHRDCARARRPVKKTRRDTARWSHDHTRVLRTLLDSDGRRTCRRQQTFL